MTQEQLTQFNRIYHVSYMAIRNLGPYGTVPVNAVRPDGTHIPGASPSDCEVELKLSIHDFRRLLLRALEIGDGAPDLQLSNKFIDQNQILVAKFSLDSMSLDEAKSMLIRIKDNCGDTPIIAIPSDADLITMNVEELEKIKSLITEMIEASDYNKLLDCKSD